jgi:hypothetical protein
METCVSCEDRRERFAVVGVGREIPEAEAAELGRTESRHGTGTFVAYGICPPCHTNPARRPVALKLSYHDRGLMAEALKNAGGTGLRTPARTQE